jgi:hypothetical protein
MAYDSDPLDKQLHKKGIAFADSAKAILSTLQDAQNVTPIQPCKELKMPAHHYPRPCLQPIIHQF